MPRVRLVPGMNIYGTVQSLLVLKCELEKRKWPVIIPYGFISHVVL